MYSLSELRKRLILIFNLNLSLLIVLEDLDIQLDFARFLQLLVAHVGVAILLVLLLNVEVKDLLYYLRNILLKIV